MSEFDAPESTELPEGMKMTRKEFLKAMGGAGAVGLGAATASVGPPPETPESGVRFYVAPDGNDDWNGKRPEHRGEGKIGPFQTLERARNAIRRLKKKDDYPDKGVTVSLRGGEYNRSESLVLDKRDSGTSEGPVTYRAYDDEDPQLVGGATLDADGFGAVTDESVRERLPDPDAVVQYDLAADGIDEYGELVPTGFGLPSAPPEPELFVGDETMRLARWPSNGFVQIGTVDGPGPEPRPRDASDPTQDPVESMVEWVDAGKPRPLPEYLDDGATFEYRDERPETWKSVDDVWMYGYWYYDWADGSLEIADLDPETNRITTETASWYNVRSGQRYYYYNVLDELDQPGEFYIDRDEGVLYLFPPDQLADTEIQLSLLADPLVRVEGASHVGFDGVSFQVSRGTGAELAGTNRVVLRDCTFRRLGEHAARITEGEGSDSASADSGLAGCDIRATGKGGVDLGGGDRQTLRPGNNYVVDCDVRNFSRVQRTYTPAVGLSGVGNRVAHNHLHRAPHMAIDINGNEHVVEYNDIHDVARETSDVGAQYMGRDWSERGNVIRYNYFHHIQGVEGIGQMGVYLDDMASDTTVFGNVFFDVNRAMLVGGGRNNRIRNNAIVDCEEAIRFDARGLGWAHDHCEPGGVLRAYVREMPYTEDPWASTYPELVDILSDEPCAPRYNVVSDNVISGSPAPSLADAVPEDGIVEDNWVTDEDPGFVDKSSEDFRLREDAQLYDEIPEFDPIPFSEVGPRKD